MRKTMGKIGALAVAGGGTGGHLFPGLAIAAEFRRREAGVRIMYIGVAGKLEEKMVPAAGIEFHGLKMSGLKGLGLGRKIRGLLLAGRAFGECRRLLARFRPDLLVGTGGYSSGPAALAAWTLGIPVVLQEQNTVPGLTNRILGRLAKKIFLAFEEAAAGFPAGRTVATGNPVREEVVGREREVGSHETLNVLVLGGGRGAVGLNRLVVAAFERLGEEGRRVRVMHQSGADDEPWVEKAYRRAGVSAEIKPFISDMGEGYAWSDIVISRAGAGAISELTVNGRPALLVPFPHSAGDHQRKNARWMVEKGGAVIVEEGGEEMVAELAVELKTLMGDRHLLRKMAASSRRAGRRDAAAAIVSECSELLGDRRG
jgi:UDP-N-acetylglucosamine--N-acetylmuramyl-(pentapeptide) pyrophosphoryl-undecaprenol N-acetylglucosamine transferase